MMKNSNIDHGYCENCNSLQKQIADMKNILECKKRVEEDQRLGQQREIRLKQQPTEESLLTSDDYLQSVFRASPVGIGVVVNRLIQKVNDRFLEITGYEQNEIIGQSSRILYLDDEAFNYVGNEKYRQIDELGTGTVETLWKRKDGSIINILLSSTPLDASDLTKGVTFTALNITRRKQAEQAVLERERYFRSLFENAGDAILIEDESDHIIDVNRQACDLLGYSREEFLRLNVVDIQAPGYQGQKGSVIKNELRLSCGVPFETVDIRKDGSKVPVEVTTVPLTTGEKRLALSIVRNITDRKQAEADRERLVQAIDQSGDIFIITDPEWNIQYANSALTKITGFRISEVVGRHINIFSGEEPDSPIHLDLKMTLRSGKKWKGRLLSKRKDGSVYTEEVTISPVFGEDGEIVNYINVKVDITEKLKNEHDKALLEKQYIQAQKLEAVGRLAGGVAHDFNNMLSVIIGYAELAQEKRTCGKIEEELDIILKAAKKSADIVKQLLAFARQQTISPKVIDLNDTVENILKMLRRLIGEDLDLVWVPNKKLWPVKVDPSQIDQILANLCVNARDAIKDVGKVTIETGKKTFDEEYCSAHPGFIPGDFVSLIVSDNGCGMEKDMLDHIFEPFFTSKEVGKGTGLGLATVHGIVKQNNGFINVYSEPGKGTTFKVYLRRHAEPAEEDLETTFSLIPSSRGENILLVEDEPELLLLTQKMLQQQGYFVLSAINPIEALNLIKNTEVTIDLLITDVVMPEMNGRELARKLKLLYPALKVLFTSGYTANVIAHHGVLDADIQFIQKPFTRKDLATKVREVIDLVRF